LLSASGETEGLDEFVEFAAAFLSAGFATVAELRAEEDPTEGVAIGVGFGAGAGIAVEVVVGCGAT
jgi:hypothetical protein